MQVDAIDLVLRPRSMWEGCDLGVRLLQSWQRPVFRCYLGVALPVFLILLTTYQIAAWLPCLLIWLSKPWLDRTILFALSRALFGRPTTLKDVWESRADAWWSQPLMTWVAQRLSASRSFRQPVLQLERLSGRERRARAKQLSQRHRGVARAVTEVFALAEIALTISILSIALWLAPHAFEVESLSARAGHLFDNGVFVSLAYAASVAFLEPFYVAAGFGMYLNRRVELEAWDIEQEFRRAFAA